MLLLVVIAASYLIDVIVRSIKQVRISNEVSYEEYAPSKKCICGAHTKSYHIKVFPDDPKTGNEFTGYYCASCITALCRNGHYIELL